MTPFEDLIHDLGNVMQLELHPDALQSCLLTFPDSEISIQIDLDTSGNQILVGTQIGMLPAGSYRERIFLQAMRVNGGSVTPRGILAYSEKNHTLVLFQFLSIAFLNGEKLNRFIQVFLEHAKAWKEAILHGDVPLLEESMPFGTNR